MKKISFTIVLLILFASCNSSKNFEKSTVKNLYLALKNQQDFKSDLTENTLFEFLKNVNILELENGIEFEKELFFEKCECDCKDKISIKCSKGGKLFELNIYEESFENDLDWCPETSYIFTFQIKNNKIQDFRLKFIAG